MVYIYDRFIKEWRPVDKSTAELAKLFLTVCPLFSWKKTGNTIAVKLVPQDAWVFVRSCSKIVTDAWETQSTIDTDKIQGTREAFLSITVRFPMSDYDKVMNVMKKSSAKNGVHIVPRKAA